MSTSNSLSKKGLMKRFRVLLAENLALIRRGIKSELAPNEDLEIVGETETAEEAVRLARELKPNIVLMDRGLVEGGEDELVSIREIKRISPDIEVVIMTDRLDGAKALRAIEAGAVGYILKDVPGTNLAAAIRSVCSGRTFLHPEITRELMGRLNRLMVERRLGQRLRSRGLTPRELDILMQVAQGRTDHEIADHLVVAEGTIKTHIRHILRKLPARNRAQAVAYVLRKGLLE